MNNTIPHEYVTSFVQTNQALMQHLATALLTGGDQGADPNKLVTITDTLSNSSLPAAESFSTLRTAGYAEVLRGVSFGPGGSH
jgi:hypothetical protein